MGGKTSITDQSGTLIEGTEVEILESLGRFNEVKLEDGTVLKAKLVVTGVVRVSDQWDAQGNPIYLIQSQNVVTISKCPDSLKRTLVQ